jgi:hypothetical protein
MKRTLAVAAIAVLMTANAFATYIVVLKNGQTYKAKAKWTMQNGKALVQLENGQSLAVDPSLIDVAKSEQTTNAGLNGAKILNIPTNNAAPQPQPQQSTLGQSFHLRKGPAPAPPVTTTAAAVPITPSGATLSQDVLEKFARAYENVGLFEQKITSPAAGTIHAELTADSEDKVFNAISATSFLIVRNAGVPGVDIKMVELFMRTTVGGSAGRFQMTKVEAQDLESKGTSPRALQEYFIRHVIY